MSGSKNTRPKKLLPVRRGPWPMRVLYVNHVGEVSGAEESLLAVLAALDRDRIVPSLACPDGPLAARAAELGVPVFPLPQARLRRTLNPARLCGYNWTWVRAVGRLKRVIRGERCRIVHANSTSAQVFAGGAARRCRIPAIWHLRDLAPLHGLGRILSARARRVLAISRAVAARAAGDGVERAKLRVVYNGIDPRALAERADGDAQGIGAGDRLVTMAAQMVPWKRHRDFICALSVAAFRVPRVRGLIVGGDLFGEHAGYRERLERISREQGVADRIEFLGYRRDVPAILRASEVVVLPSRAEPFGRVALEAMALARPVVGTRAGGLPELVEDQETGILVPPGDWRQMADAIVKILRYRDYAAWLGKQGAQRAEDCFHIRRTVHMLEETYEELIGLRGRRACASA